MLTHFAVNWLAVIVATIASFAFGAAWYMGLSKQWLAAIDKPMEQLGKGATPFIWGMLAELVMAYFIATLTPALLGEASVVNGLIVGAHLWFGFVLTSLIMNHRYEGMKWSLTLLDGAHLLGVLLIQGVIIGLFG